MTSDNTARGIPRRRLAILIAIACAILITAATITAIRVTSVSTTAATPTSTAAPAADTKTPDELTCDAYLSATGYNSTVPAPADETPQQWGTSTRETMTSLEAHIAPGTHELVTTPLRAWIATQHQRASIALSGGAPSTAENRALAQSTSVQAACRTAAPRSFR